MVATIFFAAAAASELRRLAIPAKSRGRETPCRVACALTGSPAPASASCVSRCKKIRRRTDASGRDGRPSRLRASVRICRYQRQSWMPSGVPSSRGSADPRAGCSSISASASAASHRALRAPARASRQPARRAASQRRSPAMISEPQFCVDLGRNEISVCMDSSQSHGSTRPGSLRSSARFRRHPGDRRSRYFARGVMRSEVAMVRSDRRAAAALDVGPDNSASEPSPRSSPTQPLTTPGWQRRGCSAPAVRSSASPPVEARGTPVSALASGPGVRYGARRSFGALQASRKGHCAGITVAVELAAVPKIMLLQVGYDTLSASHVLRVRVENIVGAAALRSRGARVWGWARTFLGIVLHPDRRRPSSA